jgi:acyl-CoA dehydrogenase
MREHASLEHSLTRAAAISHNVLRQWAADVDANNRFPSESVEALRDAGLLAFMVPAQFGGQGGNMRALWRIAAVLGEECLATALIWSMHSQQVAVLADHAHAEQAELLRHIATHGLLIASVTTERDKGGDLLTAHAPLVREHNHWRVRRFAPIVSYGAEADMYLITMRSGEDRLPHDVSLVLTTPEDGLVTVEGDWHAMGMKGTRSVPMRFDTLVDANRIIGQTFRQVALQTMIPIGHVAWSAAWFGAAGGALQRFIERARTSRGPGAWDLHSDLFTTRLARLRLWLDLLQSMLEQITTTLDAWRLVQAPMHQYEDITHNIALNNLKVASSELAFAVVHNLMELAGMRHGYLQHNDLGLERVFRDLRSGSLMYHNDRLIQTNGNLLLIERTPMSRVWASRGLHDSAECGAPDLTCLA